MTNNSSIHNKFRQVHSATPCWFCDKKINYFSCNNCSAVDATHENPPYNKCKYCDQDSKCSICLLDAYGSCICCNKIICIAHANPINNDMTDDYLMRMKIKLFTFYVVCEDCVEFTAPFKNAEYIIKGYKKQRIPQIRVILRMLFAQKNMYDNKFIVSFSNALFGYIHLM